MQCLVSSHLLRSHFTDQEMDTEVDGTWPRWASGPGRQTPQTLLTPHCPTFLCFQRASVVLRSTTGCQEWGPCLQREGMTDTTFELLLHTYVGLWKETFPAHLRMVMSLVQNARFRVGHTVLSYSQERAQTSQPGPRSEVPVCSSPQWTVGVRQGMMVVSPQ